MRNIFNKLMGFGRKRCSITKDQGDTAPIGYCSYGHCGVTSPGLVLTGRRAELAQPAAIVLAGQRCFVLSYLFDTANAATDHQPLFYALATADAFETVGTAPFVDPLDADRRAEAAFANPRH
jgi:hypothetical protein